MATQTKPSTYKTSGDLARTPSDPWARTLTGLWIGLAAAVALGAASGAEAGPRKAKLGPTPIANPSPAGYGRILLAVQTGTQPLHGASEDVFALVGNRTGLASAVRVETRGNEVWLTASAPSPDPEVVFARRNPSPTAFQGTSSSVASR